jgi:hypothetical protein
MASGKFALLALGLIGCTGAIQRDGSDPTPPSRPGQTNTPPNGMSSTTPPGMTGGPQGADASGAGPMPLRRLDRREYNNTVRDLLGDNTRPADKFPDDQDTSLGFRRPGLVSSQDFSTVRDAAEALAAGVASKVATLAPCSGPEETCARTFATSFGLRAFRRPLAAAEVDDLMLLYKDGRTTLALDHAGAIGLMVEGVLQSPSFLYHWESGPAAPALEGKLVKRSAYENASQLSYFLWGSMPDQALFDAAAASKLGTPAELEAQARRLLADPRARDTVAQFVEEWLSTDQVAERPKDPKEYPQFTDDLKGAMSAEARAFASNVIFDGDGKLGTLLTATFSFVNQPLAAVYGVSGVSGMDLKQAQLNAQERSGLLTQPAFLTVTGSTNGSHPVKRGRKVYERFLCGELPPPPAMVPPPKPASEGGTTRDRFKEHSANACANACHSLMDPLGFAFEHYDGIGRYRTMDNGGKVDSSGAITVDGKLQSFQDARELTGILAGSAEVQRCFVRQWVRFALKRSETDADAGSIDSVVAAFNKGGQSVRDLLVGIATARSFRYRAPAAGEMLQ